MDEISLDEHHRESPDICIEEELPGEGRNKERPGLALKAVESDILI